MYSSNNKNMEEKKKMLRLGSRVMCGGVYGVVDALTQSYVGVLLQGGGYRVVPWDDVEFGEEGRIL